MVDTALVAKLFRSPNICCKPNRNIGAAALAVAVAQTLYEVFVI